MHLRPICLFRGHAAVALKHNQFVVDNGGEGFDIHDLNTGKYIRNLSTGLPLRRYPKQVCYAEDYKVIVTGSDHGKVHLFETLTGQPLQMLKHPDGGLVQTVAVRL
ncbi:MAG TPA: hypothetical protein VGO47_10655 [Chlamydiales bacterium]|nr:hypothetical protein [Chlamydiales bacterium]